MKFSRCLFVAALLEQQSVFRAHMVNHATIHHKIQNHVLKAIILLLVLQVVRSVIQDYMSFRMAQDVNLVLQDIIARIQGKLQHCSHREAST